MNDETENSVMIERTLDAPVDLVWQMWTDPDHFAAWYGPMGATIPKAEMDVRVGGRRLICMAMETPNGPMQMWFTGEYREVVPNQRLVYTEAMSDEDGNIQIGEGHPESTNVIVELEDLGGKTRMTMTHVGIPADSPGAAGWAMALDSLASHLESMTY